MKSYWAVELNANDFDFLQTNPILTHLSHIHSTLLICNTTTKTKEQYYQPFNMIDCTCIIDGYHQDNNACVLSVLCVIANQQRVLFFSKQQHVTLALRDGVEAKHSVRAFKSPFQAFDDLLIVGGTIKKLSSPVPHDTIWFYSAKQQHGYLSNFYPSPITINNINYYHVEGYFQSQKSSNNTISTHQIRCKIKTNG